MLKYIFTRVLFFIPTIFAISLLTFVLMSNAPGDPVENMLTRNQGGEGGQSADKIAGEKAYDNLRKKLGLNLPMFYFSLSSKASSDTLYKIAKPDYRKTLERLSYETGNWPLVQDYYQSVRQLEFAILDLPKDSSTVTPLITLRSAISNLYLNYQDAVITHSLDNMTKVLHQQPSLQGALPALKNVTGAYANLMNHKTFWKNYIPSLFWNGTKCQYHRWLFGDAPWFSKSEDETLSSGFLRGDFGISYFAKRPVSSMIWESIWYTMLISFVAILLTYVISIPLGVYSAVNKDTPADQAISTSLFVLYSLPNFWIATLGIFFLCGGDYLNIFPPTGVADYDVSDPLFLKIGMQAYYLALPLICWTYGSFAYLSRQMRGGMLAVLRQDYIRTAQSKGLEKKKVVWKHAFRNSLLPVITIFSSVFPAMIGGSVVLEFIFTIPGMGKLGFGAVLQRDYPVILTVTMFSAILTLVGYLVSDILYAVVDPRISYSKK